MKASEIEAAASVAGVVREGDTLSAEATWFIARALLRLHSILSAPLPDDLAAIGERVDSVADYHVKCALFGNSGPDARAFHERATAILSTDVPRLLAAYRARDAEVARLDRLAKAERAYRVALCDRQTNESSMYAVAAASEELRAAGGVP